jgi:transcriptional regulator with XRE-family HTH domain
MQAVISSAQCRAARALLDWTRERLAEASGVSVRMLNDLETGTRVPRRSTSAAIVSAFGKAGIVFVFAPDVTGGVILLR